MRNFSVDYFVEHYDDCMEEPMPFSITMPDGESVVCISKEEYQEMAAAMARISGNDNQHD